MVKHSETVVYYLHDRLRAFTVLVIRTGHILSLLVFYPGYHDNHIVIRWFWAAVERFNNEQRLRLLQVSVEEKCELF